MGFEVALGAGELKVNGVSMHTAAWRIRNVSLLQFDSSLRGEYVTIPGKDGEDPVPMRNTSAQWNLDFQMVGDVDHTGAAYAADGIYRAEQVGLASNMNYLRTNVLTGRTLTGNRTRAATFQVPGEASPREADIHCWLIPGANTDWRIWEGQLVVRIPTGMFL